MHRSTQLSRNILHLPHIILLLTLVLYQTTVLASQICQIDTHEHCSKKELQYITQMTSKSSQERLSAISQLQDFLNRIDKEESASLIPWIEQRLHILHVLEGLDEHYGTVVETTDESSPMDERPDPNTRLITPTELATHITLENGVWLSILGKVYDVTTGPSFYGPDGSYKFYAGRDASPCYSTGINNVKGANEHLEEWEDGKRLLAILEWSEFYENHETYVYLGRLAGCKFYDERGEETKVRKIVVEKALEARAVAEKEKEEKKKVRLEKKRRLEEERRRKKVEMQQNQQQKEL